MARKFGREARKLLAEINGPIAVPRGQKLRGAMKDGTLDAKKGNAVISDFVRERITLKMEALFAIYEVGPGPHRWEHLAAALAQDLYPNAFKVTYNTQPAEPTTPATDKRKKGDWTPALMAKLVSEVETQASLLPKRAGGLLNIKKAADLVSEKSLTPEFKGRSDLRTRYIEYKRKRREASSVGVET